MWPPVNPKPGDDCNGDVSLKVANWLRGSDQITNSFDVQFFADVSRARNTGFFVFGIEASMDWPRKSFTLERETRVNPITQALAMRQLLGIPGIATKADIAKHLGISRARVTQTLNLLKLAPEIQQHILELPDDGTAFFSEHRLRHTDRGLPRTCLRSAYKEHVRHIPPAFPLLSYLAVVYHLERVHRPIADARNKLAGRKKVRPKLQAIE